MSGTDKPSGAVFMHMISAGERAIIAWEDRNPGLLGRAEAAWVAMEAVRRERTPATPVSDPSREVLTAFAESLDAVPFDTASAAHFSFDTTHGHARVLRRAVRELLDRAATWQPPYKPFWENPDGPGAA